MCQYDACKFLKDRFPGVIQDDKKYPYEMTETIRMYLNLPIRSSSSESPYIYISTKMDHLYGNYPLNIAGYDVITFIE